MPNLESLGYRELQVSSLQNKQNKKPPPGGTVCMCGADTPPIQSNQPHQAMCKAQGLRAVGPKEELLARLQNHHPINNNNNNNDDDDDDDEEEVDAASGLEGLSYRELQVRETGLPRSCLSPVETDVSIHPIRPCARPRASAPSARRRSYLRGCRTIGRASTTTTKTTTRWTPRRAWKGSATASSKCVKRAL